MNRELIVSLLKKNIDDLILLTEGFEQMTTYPDALIQLAQLKTNDIKQYLYELGELKHTALVEEPVGVPVEEPVGEPVATPEIRFEEEEKFEYVTAEKESEEDVVMEPEPGHEQEPEEETKAEALQTELTILEIPYEEPVSPTEPEIIPAAISTPVSNQSIPAAEAPEIRKTTLGETINNGVSRNDIHSTREPERFNNAMANKKIDDIRQAISIGDRFRFQRELFRNNGEEMNKMLSYINLLASFNEIEAFLQKKYGWETDNEVAKDFYAIVRRKFI